MSDDWKVGDLALCTDAKPTGAGYMATGLEEGRIYHVVRVGVRRGYLAVLGLNCDMSGFEDGLAGAGRFRKIRPDEAEGNAEDWALILETAKPRVKQTENS